MNQFKGGGAASTARVAGVVTAGFPPSDDESCGVDVTADARNKMKGQGCSGTALASLDVSTECPETESDQARRPKVWMLQGNSKSILS